MPGPARPGRHPQWRAAAREPRRRDPWLMTPHAWSGGSRNESRLQLFKFPAPADAWRPGSSGPGPRWRPGRRIGLGGRASAEPATEARQPGSGYRHCHGHESVALASPVGRPRRTTEARRRHII